MYYYNLPPRYSIPVTGGRFTPSKSGSGWTYNKSKYARYVAQHFNVPTQQVLNNWKYYSNWLHSMEIHNEPLQVYYIPEEQHNVSELHPPPERTPRIPVPDTRTEAPTTDPTPPSAAPVQPVPDTPKQPNPTDTSAVPNVAHTEYNNHINDGYVEEIEIDEPFTPEGLGITHKLLNINYFGPGPANIRNSEETVLQYAAKNAQDIVVQMDLAAYYHDKGVQEAQNFVRSGGDMDTAWNIIIKNDDKFIQQIEHLYNNRHKFSNGDSFRAKLMRYAAPFVKSWIGQYWQGSYLKRTLENDTVLKRPKKRLRQLPSSTTRNPASKRQRDLNALLQTPPHKKHRRLTLQYPFKHRSKWSYGYSYNLKKFLKKIKKL